MNCDTHKVSGQPVGRDLAVHQLQQRNEGTYNSKNGSCPLHSRRDFFSIDIVPDCLQNGDRGSILSTPDRFLVGHILGKRRNNCASPEVALHTAIWKVTEFILVRAAIGSAQGFADGGLGLGGSIYFDDALDDMYELGKRLFSVHTELLTRSFPLMERDTAA